MKNLLKWLIITHLGRITLGGSGMFIFGMLYKFIDSEWLKYTMFGFVAIWVVELLIIMGSGIKNLFKKK